MNTQENNELRKEIVASCCKLEISITMYMHFLHRYMLANNGHLYMFLLIRNLSPQFVNLSPRVTVVFTVKVRIAPKRMKLSRM